MVSRKGVYPYDLMDSVTMFDQTKLPPKKVFHSKLNDSDISDEDYEHANNLRNDFKMKTISDYHDLYLNSDIFLLGDVFEEVRNVCLEVDCAWYFTAPILAWNAALKVTNVEVELLRDLDMLLIIEGGIGGGMSMISNRFGRGNNKYMGKAYDATKSTKYITSRDENNFHG